MLKIKRRDDPTTTSNQRQKTCEQGEKTRDLHLDDTLEDALSSLSDFDEGHLDDTLEDALSSLSDFDEGVWCELSEKLASKLSESVVSLASFVGNKMHFACTGIVIKSIRNSSNFLTSADLIRSRDGERRMIPNFMIKVCLPNKQVVKGRLKYYDSPYNIIVVTTKHFPNLRAALLDHHMQAYSLTEVLALRRCFHSDKLMATCGVLVDSPSGDHSEELMLSTCKITAVGIGGPLVDFDGNIVGMSMYAREMTLFLPRNRIIEHLEPLGLLGPAFMSYMFSRVGSNQEGYSTRERTTNEIQKSLTPYNRSSEGSSPMVQGSSSGGSENKNQKVCAFSIPEPQELTDNQSKHLPSLCPWTSNAFTDEANEIIRSKGCPLPIYFDGGMHCKNTFEDEFGEDIWSEPTKKVASKLSRSVVSLASFNGKTRFFACTGVFIDCNESTTSVLTSASLVRTSGDEDKIDHNLTIEVCLPSKRHAKGTLQHYNLRYNVAVVSIMGFRSHRAAKLDEAPQREVVALGRRFESGKLMATNGVVTNKRSRFDCKELKISTCKITKAGIGGPLVDFDGNFVGMNFYDTEETPYLPRKIILKLLRHFDAKRTVAGGIMDKCNYRWPVPEIYWYYPSLHDPDLDEPEEVLE